MSLSLVSGLFISHVTADCSIFFFILRTPNKLLIIMVPRHLAGDGGGVTLQLLLCSVSSGGIGVGVGQWNGGWGCGGFIQNYREEPLLLDDKTVFQPFSVRLQSTPFNPNPLSPHPGSPPSPPPYPGFHHNPRPPSILFPRCKEHVAIYMELNCATFSMWPSTCNMELNCATFKWTLSSTSHCS